MIDQWLSGGWKAVLLRGRVWRLCRHLQGRGITAYLRNQFRPRSVAHKWSTAYHIVSGPIELGALRALPAGCDYDDTLWFRLEWGAALPDETLASLVPEVTANAVQQAAKKLTYAEEGYAPNDPRRLPNSARVPVSKHIIGWAIDAKVEWEALGGPWSEVACAVVARFGLARPVEAEHWHFELLSKS